MTTNTKSAHERTASIDLEKLERLIAELKAAELMDDQCGHALLQGHGVLMDLAWLKRVVDFARRSLTSGALAHNAAAKTEQANSDSDKSFLQWIHDRMRFVHGENENYDYMHKLRAVIAAMSGSESTPNVASIAAGAGSAQQADTKGAALDEEQSFQKWMEALPTNADPHYLDVWMASAAISRNATPEVPAAPMNWPLPCDIKVGAVTIRKGCGLRTLVTRMESLQRMAMKAFPEPTPEARELIDAMIRGEEIPVALHEPPGRDAGQEEASTQTVPTIDTSEFHKLLREYANALAAVALCEPETVEDEFKACKALIAYIDGRTAGTTGGDK